MKKFAALPLAVLFGVFPLFAQVDAGYVTGHVYDNSKAVVPSAQVQIRNLGTDYTVSVQTNESGVYASPPLPFGHYRVTVQKPGFEASASEIDVNLGGRAGLDFELQVGTQATTVEVKAQAAALQTESTTLSTFRSENEVEDFPSNSRNYADIVRFSPGTVPGQAQTNNLALSQQRGNTSNSVNGVSFTANYFLVDGLYNNENHQGYGLMVFPEVEAIEQYRVETSVPDARFGGGGAAVNVGYKSGTDEFHGDAFYFVRNSDLDARNFFATGVKPALHKNLYGGILGGPIGGKNAKTFFFVSYEGERTTQAQTYLDSVPTVAMKNGDFSVLLQQAKPNIIYDPLTTTPQGSSYSRTPFPGNIIPAARFNPVAAKVIAVYPNPNEPGLSGNFLYNPANTTDNDQGSVKIDHNFSAGSRAFIRVTRGDADYVNPEPLGPPATPSVGVDVPVTQAVLSYTQIISPRMINQSRFGFTREALTSLSLNGGQNLAEQLGIQNVNVNNFSTGLSQFNVTGLTTMGDFQNRPAILVMNYFQYGDNFNWVHGNHSMQFGADVVRRQMNAFQATNPRGLFTYTTIYTSNPVSSANTGSGAADLLLGNPATVALTALNGTRGLRRTDWAGYFQDDWKLTSRLTLNLGLRYEYAQNYPEAEVANRLVNFNFATGQPQQVTSGAGIPPDRHEWAPRIGSAYRINNKTVFRAAYGIFYAIPAKPIVSSLAANAPYYYNTSVTNNQFDFLDARPIQDGPVRTLDPNTTGLSYYAISQSYVIPYIQQWNAALQRTLPGNQQLTVAYVGTKGTHLTDSLDLNQPVPGSTAVNSRRPYPNYSGITTDVPWDNSTYHALQVLLARTLTTDLSYQFSYTLAHNISATSADLPISNLHDEKGNDATDTRQQVRATVTYELPFGRGKHFAHGAPVALNTLIGGWKTLAAITAYSGMPFTPIASSNSLNIGVTSRAERLGNGNLPADQRTIQHWFDVAAFSNPPANQWGNSGPNILVGPGTKEVDLSLFKRFDIYEKKYLEFRTEAFNVANTPQFNNPAATIGSPGAGQITSAGADVTLQRTERQIQMSLKFVF